MYKNMSDSGLKMIHEGIARAANADLTNTTKVDPYYGVKEHADWGAHRDALEDEMQKRSIPFKPVTW